MTDTLIAPTPERAQHDDVVAQPAGRNNKARIYVRPIYDRWAEKGIIDERQRSAAQRYVEDSETAVATLKSCLDRLDRVDYAAAGAIEAEGVNGALERLLAVEASLGHAGAILVGRVLLLGQTPEEATGKHKRVAQGMIVMALEVIAVAYEEFKKD